MSYELAISIPTFLTDDLRRKPWKGNRNKLAGHCYVASEVYYHLTGAHLSRWRPMFVRHEGAPHWFLMDSLGNIVDITASQFKKPVPYHKGRGKGFLTLKPSRRAQIVMDHLNRICPSCRQPIV